MTKTITFWQNTLSIHQAPLIRELASRPDIKIRVVAERGISEKRRAQGWDDPNYGRAEIHVEPNTESLYKLLQESKIDSAHIFSGIGVYPMVEAARSWLSQHATGKLIAQTESFDTHTLLRKLRYSSRRYSIMKLTKNYDSILACGSTGVNQWKSISKNDQQIKEFGYFVERKIHRLGVKSSVFRVIFVGSLDKNKNPESLIRALNELPNMNWKARFIGDGPLRSHLETIAQRLGLQENIHFTGILSNDETVDSILDSDVLVLASSHDGWGAVVNEALMHGTRTIVSRRAGSSTLLSDSKLGTAFKPGNVNELSRSLYKYAQMGLEDTQRKEIVNWSESSIAPRVIANYLLEIITKKNHEHVQPPWKNSSV